MTAASGRTRTNAPGTPRNAAAAARPSIGTVDLEKGMLASHISGFATVLAIGLVMLAVFNSEGLVRWTQRLPSGALNIWVAERAADWDHLMRQPPSVVLTELRRILGGGR